MEGGGEGDIREMEREGKTRPQWADSYSRRI